MSVLIQSLEKETKQKKRRVGRPSNPETLHPSETSQAFLKFKESLDTSEPDTQNSYIRWLCQFMKFCQVGDNADLLLFDNGSNPKIIEDKIRKFLLH
jgi:hypothetical protein